VTERSSKAADVFGMNADKGHKISHSYFLKYTPYPKTFRIKDVGFKELHILCDVPVFYDQPFLGKIGEVRLELHVERNQNEISPMIFRVDSQH
jgi:hypothetical protein